MNRFRLPPLLGLVVLLAGCATAPTLRPAHQHTAEEDRALVEAFGYVPEHSHGTAGPAADDDGFESSREGRFRIRVEPAGGAFVTGDNAVTIELRDDSGRPVADATLEVVPWMPLHGHGISDRPLVSAGAKGRYTLRTLSLPMPGLWELRLAVRAGDREDSFSYGPFTAAPAPAAEVAYLKSRSPAGYNVTLGVERTPSVLRPEVLVDAQGRTIKHFHLAVRETQVELYPGKTVLAWTFNGELPGPEMRVREGDLVRITLTNEVRDSHHTVHVHGLRKTVQSDGVPFLSQVPTEFGENYTYEFLATPSGTSWYHCHVDSAHHVDMGMYGPFIVEPAEPEVAFDREYTLLLDEWPSTEPGGENGGHAHGGTIPAAPKRIWYPETYNAYQPTYDTFLINGRSFPYTTPLDVTTGERVKVRIINAGFEPHYIHLHAHKFLVTHVDGRPVANPQSMDTVHVGPGQRADLLITADNPGIWPLHCHRIPHVANDHIYPGGMLTFLRYVDWEGAAPVKTETQDDFFDDLE